MSAQLVHDESGEADPIRVVRGAGGEEGLEVLAEQTVERAPLRIAGARVEDRGWRAAADSTARSGLAR